MTGPTAPPEIDKGAPFARAAVAAHTRSSHPPLLTLTSAPRQSRRAHSCSGSGLACDSPRAARHSPHSKQGSPRAATPDHARDQSPHSDASTPIPRSSTVDTTIMNALDADIESSLEWINHPAVFSRDSRKAVLQAIGVISSQRAYIFRTASQAHVSPISCSGSSKQWSPEDGVWMVWWMKYQVFAPILALQGLNLFWYFVIWRIAYR